VCIALKTLQCYENAHGLMWGSRGAFPPVAAMTVAVVMPVVFVLRLLKNAIKILKLVVCKQFLYLSLYTCHRLWHYGGKHSLLNVIIC
jgi:hypothetical protein